MFYIATPNGLSITEAGRSPLFVNKTHPMFEEISSNISKMSYNQILEMIDLKSKVVGFVNENVEICFNQDDDLEAQMKFERVPTHIREESVDLLIHAIKNGKEDSFDDKEKALIALLEKEDIKLVGFKLIFE